MTRSFLIHGCSSFQAPNTLHVYGVVRAFWFAPKKTSTFALFNIN